MFKLFSFVGESQRTRVAIILDCDWKGLTDSSNKQTKDYIPHFNPQRATMSLLVFYLLHLYDE